MDFMIHGIYSYEFFGETVWITTSHVCVLIVLLVLLGFALAANRKIRRAARELSDREAPGGMVNFLELLVEKLDDMVEHAMGIRADMDSENPASAPGEDLGRTLFAAAVLASAVGSGQSDQRAGDTALPVLEAVCQRAVRDRHACAGLWAAPGDRLCVAGCSSRVL